MKVATPANVQAKKNSNSGVGGIGVGGLTLSGLLAGITFSGHTLPGTLLLLSPVIIVFFFLGIYVGSRFVGTASSTSVSANGSPVLAVNGDGGLPGTKNLFHKWPVAPPVRNLRGEAIEERNLVLSELIEKENNLPVVDNKTFQDKQALYETPTLTAAASETISETVVATDAVVRSSSLYASKKSYMVGPTNLDSNLIVLGAWIHLNTDGFYDQDMRTVVANKRAGCEAKPERTGFALYVNSWQTSDHKVSVEYGGTESGCNKLDSGSVTLQAGQWHHVAVAFMNEFSSLFVDGSLVAQSDSLEQHQVQKQQPLVVGQYEGGSYAFFGNISQLTIVHPSHFLDKNQVLQMVQAMMHAGDSSQDGRKGIQSIKDLQAYYLLSDAEREIDGSRAKEFVHGNHGVYHFPVIHGLRFEGVDIPLVDAVNGRPVTEEMKVDSDRLGRERREIIRNSMRFVWDKYVKYAWGRDELKPISRTGSDNWGGMGVTLVDSLDTLWIMGMHKEFDEAKEWVANQLTFVNAGAVSVFETTIRELGGLLSAYDLSGDEVFLTKAVELGHLLAPAFNSQTGIAHGMINLLTGEATQGWAGSAAVLSEFGTLQLEFRKLALASKNPSLEKKAMRAIQLMSTKHPNYGLFPIKVDIGSGDWAESHVTFGALGDSFYEYLLKVWIQGGKKEMWLREMYDKAIEGVVHVLLKASDQSGLAFLSDWTGHHNVRKMDHLVCFMPGTMALGAYTDPLGLDSSRAKRDLAIAKALMYTCREMYHRMTSGISPEYVEFPEGNAGGDMVVGSTAPFYILRPETAESLFILNQLTGDPIYREWAWEIFSAIEQHCRIPDGYGALRDVNNPKEGVDDRMESFFLAETMKYLFLAQDPDNPIDLSKYVFNTEAHPTRIFDNHDKHVPILAS